jgi:hypothetical protein
MLVNATVVNSILDGHNYPEWAFCVQTALCGHGLPFHLTEDPPTLREDRSNAANIKTWQIDGGKVMAAMVNNTKPSMIMSLSKFTTVKTIWSHLKGRFVQDSGAFLHTIMEQTHVIEQNDMTINEYYSDFDGLMSSLLSMVPVCATNPCPAHQFIDKFFTNRFVMGFGLNMTLFVHDCSTVLILSQWQRHCLNYLLKRLASKHCLLLLVLTLTMCWLLLRSPMWQGVIPQYLVSIARSTLIGLKIVLLNFQRSWPISVHDRQLMVVAQVLRLEVQLLLHLLHQLQPRHRLGLLTQGPPFM